MGAVTLANPTSRAAGGAAQQRQILPRRRVVFVCVSQTNNALAKINVDQLVGVGGPGGRAGGCKRTHSVKAINHKAAAGGPRPWSGRRFVYIYVCWCMCARECV